MTMPESGRRLVILDDHRQFREYEEAWVTLERASDDAVFFQSFAWCGHVAETQSRHFPEYYRPFVCVGINNGQVTAIWPLCRKRLLGLWSLHNLDDPFGQFAGILARDRIEADALMRQTIDTVRRKGLAHTAVFERVTVGSPLFDGATARGGRISENTAAPFADIAGFKTYDEFRATRNKKTMKNLRNALNRMERQGDVTSHILKSGDQIDDLIARSLRNRGAWLKAKGLTSPSFRTPSHDDIVRGGEAWGLDTNRIGFDLGLNGSSVSQQWGFVHGRRYYAYMSGSEMSPSLEGAALGGVSLGGVQLGKIIAACFDEALCGIEFLTPDSRYKMVWTDTVRELADVSIDISALGTTKSLLIDRGMRPLAKAGFHRLPASLRRRLL